MYEIDKRKKSEINQEIDKLIKKNDGIINQEILVKEANKKGTALYAEFERKGLFDPQKAIKFAQLTYARYLLTQYKVWVTVEDKDPIKIRALVSLTSDRDKQGGYRSLLNVLSDNERRETLLADAKKEMITFKKKYSILAELAPVFTAIDTIA